MAILQITPEQLAASPLLNEESRALARAVETAQVDLSNARAALAERQEEEAAAKGKVASAQAKVDAAEQRAVAAGAAQINAALMALEVQA